ncbi:rhomboid family intramembrane serine protease [Gemmata sp. JC717]|uniref:Rhomboid family intramembrane serine protease n=1 Tax=Gemmata algarum TaxID=2975278 RepID=A0ABU5F4M8_9BACT|nr:rhomboid family intramembrane serine protease [Gemmata algarum]MDY3551144.1 rhomboid family intramembrane serine protease [Gemmata algarum]MDY3561762.1 rhomboid family intramembrane serine protease [Gemmata algarum]
MGIQDRDYYRDNPSFFDRVGQQGATTWLIAVTVGVFFGQMFSTIGGGFDTGPLIQYGSCRPNKVLEGEVWRLVTAVFLHGGLLHLFFNMVVLHWAGGRFEERRGGRELVLFYLIGGVFANIVFVATQVTGVAPGGDKVGAIGASGAVAAAMVVFALYYPHAQLRLYFFIPVPAWLLAILFVGFNGLMGFGHANGGVAYFAHLGGAAFGFLYYETGVEFGRLFARDPAARVRPRLRVVNAPPEEDRPEPVAAAVEAPRAAKPADEQLEAKLDAILEKVSRNGRGSLTAEENEILVQASELYKKRRK